LNGKCFSRVGHSVGKNDPVAILLQQRVDHGKGDFFVEALLRAVRTKHSRKLKIFFRLATFVRLAALGSGNLHILSVVVDLDRTKLARTIRRTDAQIHLHRLFLLAFKIELLFDNSKGNTHKLATVIRHQIKYKQKTRFFEKKKKEKKGQNSKSFELQAVTIYQSECTAWVKVDPVRTDKNKSMVGKHFQKKKSKKKKEDIRFFLSTAHNW
jgi:hypothetical protein